MTVRDTIEAKLIVAFSPNEIEVIDESHKHAGHVGARPEGETHFRVNIKGVAFDGLSRVAMQRLIYKALDAELKGPVHALSLKVAGS